MAPLPWYKFLSWFHSVAVIKIASRTVTEGNHGGINTPLILALRKKRQAGLFDFQVSLVYVVSFRLARATW